jgi:hypothetical protein
MAFFRTRRLNGFVVAYLALAILLTQGARVYLHVHDDPLHELLSNDAAGMHAHVESGSALLDLSEDASHTIDLSLDAILKLLNIHPLLALITVSLLLFAFVRPVSTFSPRKDVQLYFPDPPYLSPPGHGPPR